MEPTCCICHQIVGASGYTGRLQLGGSIQLVKPFEMGYSGYGKLFYDGCHLCRQCLLKGLSKELPNPKRNYIRPWSAGTACASCHQLYETNMGMSNSEETIAHYCSSSFSKKNPLKLYCGYESGHDGEIFSVTAKFPNDIELDNSGFQPAVICDCCMGEWVKQGWIVYVGNYM